MTRWQAMVRAFHKKFDCAIADTPTVPDRKLATLRASLIFEEAWETIEALGFERGYEGEIEPTDRRADLPKVADGLVDLIYVCLGTAVSLGVDLGPIFTEVHRANMEKLPGNLRADGKILKAAGWRPPRVAELIEQQKRKR